MPNLPSIQDKPRAPESYRAKLEELLIELGECWVQGADQLATVDEAESESTKRAAVANALAHAHNAELVLYKLIALLRDQVPVRVV